MIKRLALAVPVVLALAAVACSSDPAGEQVAVQVDREAAKQLEVEVGDVTTTCPDDAEAKEGVEFDCDVTVEDQSLTATVTFSSDEDFTFSFNGQVFDKAELEAGLKGELAEGLGAEVTELDCGGETLVVIGIGETIECEGTDATGSSGSAIVGLNDDGEAEIVDVTN